MKKTKLIITGGFLGAGKTTLIWEVARRLVLQGKRVGLVTNDQAPELVDSHILKLSSLKVAEVAGSCFCCNFNGFVEAIHNLQKDVEADVIIAEPVGSCADLSATIVNPLKQYHDTEVTMSPYSVLADPTRLKPILFGDNSGLHDDAAYIYRKQLEEADIIVITKIDTLSAEELESLKKATANAFTSAKIMTLSSQAGTGVDEWFNEVNSRTDAGSKLLDIDYDRYAHGEAVLGWLNGTLRLTGDNVNWDAMLEKVMTDLSAAFANENLPIGHVKVIIENGKAFCVGNIAGAESALTLRGTAGTSDTAKLIVNARAETTPEHLDAMVNEVLDNALQGITSEITAWRYLQPGRPNPTHRFTETV